MNNILKQFIKLLFEIIFSIRGAFWHFLKLYKKYLTITTYKAHKYKFYNSGLITKRLYQQEPFVRFGKSFERKTISLMLRILKPDFIAVDVGANIGLHSLIISKALENSIGNRIFAFEPSLATYRILEENIRINNCEERVHPINLGLSNTSGKLYLSIPNSYNDYGEEADVFKYLKEESSDGNDEIVEVTTLDSWIKENNIDRIDFIKVDIEGAELLFLKGAEYVLTNLRPIIILECYELFCKRFDYSVSDVIIFLDHLNYKILQYEEAQWIAIPIEQQFSFVYDLLN